MTRRQHPAAHRLFGKLSAFALFLILTFCAAGATAADIVTLKGGTMEMKIDDKGKISSVKDLKTGKEYVAVPNVQPGCVIMCQTTDEKAPLQQPVSAKLAGKKNNAIYIDFSYQSGVVLRVKVTQKKKYIRMELVSAKPLKKIWRIEWGPVSVAMLGPRAEWIFLARSDDFTLGMTPLEVNTVRDYAHFNGHGIKMTLRAYNQTTDRNISGEYRNVPLEITPVPNVTVLNSAIALFGCPRGRKSELDTMEAIEIGEHLAHPEWNKVWIKRSREMSRMRVWAGFNHKNYDKAIALAKDFNAITLGSFHGFFSNWGHFNVDTNSFPGGWEDIKKVAAKAKANGIQLEYYTLTYFLKPTRKSEPYLAPKQDPRLAHLKPRAKLLSAILKDDKKQLELAYDKDIAEYWKHRDKVLVLENEIIEGRSVEVQGDKIILKDLTRGQFMSSPAPHKAGTKGWILVVSGYHNAFPGTVPMHKEIAVREGNQICANGLGAICLDGFGEATGHGEYAKNIYLGALYDIFKKNKKHILVTASPSQTLFNWHMISYFSWGEFDMEKGFRGTMLDYRLGRQEQLLSNLVPAKLGQYYPDSKSSLEDIEWVMARAAGWDSGVDFCVNVDNIRQNPKYNEITAAVRLWEKAKAVNAFSEKTKMFLRQTDRLYHLSKKPDGKFDLSFKGFWHADFKMIPPSEFKIDGPSGTIKPLSIKWLPTHDPGIYSVAGISDDMVYDTAKGKQEWSVTYPQAKNPKSRQNVKLQFVLRLDPKAPCAVKNIRVFARGQSMLIPTTLKPGEYIANPHLLHRVFVYGPDHNIRREVYIPQFNPYWWIPEFKRGELVKTSVSCEPLKPGASCKLTLNLVTRELIHKN